jgi:hypothetical protein
MSAKIVNLFSSPGAFSLPAARFIAERQPLADITDDDKPILGILEAWRGVRGDTKVPPLAGSMPPETYLRNLIGFVHVVDCTPASPLDYEFRLFGSLITIFGHRDYTRSTVRGLPDAGWAQQTADDYQRVASAGCPTFHKIKLQHNYITKEYTRLILPFVDKAREINRLFVCINARKLPELGSLPS